jgi:predicted metalloprotease
MTATSHRRDLRKFVEDPNLKMTVKEIKILHLEIERTELLMKVRRLERKIARFKGVPGELLIRDTTPADSRFC